MDDFAAIAELDADAETYTDGSVLPEISYTYRVKATTSKVESDPSNEAEATTPEQVEPLIVGTESPELVVSGDDATVSVDSLGREPLTYQWYTGASGDTSAPIDGATIAFNTFVDNQGALIEIAAGFGERNRTVLPTEITVANNLMARTETGVGSFIIGENPMDQAWITNLTHNGEAGIEVEGGFVAGDPKLAANLIRQLILPASDGAAADAATNH